MGAWATTQVAAGKTPQDAYDRAVDAADAEYGHQQGYSGAINSKARGFSLVELPPRFSYAKLAQLIGEYGDAKSEVEFARDQVRDWRPDGFYGSQPGAKGRLRKAEAVLKRSEAQLARVEKRIPAALRGRFDGIVQTYNDKWDTPLAVELRPAEAKQYAYVTQRRGEKIFVFFGLAPS